MIEILLVLILLVLVFVAYKLHVLGPILSTSWALLGELIAHIRKLAEKNTPSGPTGALIFFAMLFACGVAKADSLQFCSPTVASAQSVSGTSGYTTTLSAASALKSGACTVPTPPVGLPTCQAGLAADLPGQHAVCTGAFMRHVSGPTKTPDGGMWTFEKVFGAWPGQKFAGWDAIFSLTPGQYIAIPFQPSPGHSVSFFINTTYTNSRQDVFAISTKQGVFSDGPDVICNGASNVNLLVSSNGGQVECKLDPNKVYWLNMIPGTVAARQPISPSTFVPCTVGSCVVAVQEKFQN